MISNISSRTLRIKSSKHPRKSSCSDGVWPNFVMMRSINSFASIATWAVVIGLLVHAPHASMRVKIGERLGVLLQLLALEIREPSVRFHTHSQPGLFS